jgi:hypothetical protein
VRSQADAANVALEELVMGTQELNRAYPRLKREWSAGGGYILRLTNPNVKGVPDFLISHPSVGCGLAEVKCVDDPRDIIGLEEHQAKTLDEASLGGAKGRVLVYCLKEDKWALFFGGTLRNHYRALRWQMAPRFSEKVTPDWALGDGTGSEKGLISVNEERRIKDMEKHVEEEERKRWVKSVSISHDDEESAKMSQIRGE